MHIVYFATRDEYGRLHQRIMRARWLDVYNGPNAPALDMMLPEGVSLFVTPVESVHVESEPFTPTL